MHSPPSRRLVQPSATPATGWSPIGPVGAALTSEAGEARRTLLANIGNAKNLIAAMKQDAYQGIASLESQRCMSSDE